MKSSDTQPFKFAPHEAADVLDHTFVMGATSGGMNRLFTNLMAEQMSAGGRSIVLDKGSTSELMIKKIKAKP